MGQRLLACLLCVSLVSPLHAGTPGADKRRDIRQLLEASGSLHVAQQMAQLSVDALRQSLNQCRNCTAQSFRIIEAETRALYSERAGPLNARIEALYERQFSHAEIRELLAFYRSPLGQRLVSAQSVLAREKLALGKAWQQELGPELKQRLASAFDKAGLPFPAIPAPPSAP